MSNVVKYFESYFYDGSILSFKFRFCFIKTCFCPCTYCFPVLIFCFYLYLNLCLAREFTYCHNKNVIRFQALSYVSFLQEVVFVVLELTLVLWHLSVATVRRLIYSLTIANLLQC